MEENKAPDPLNIGFFGADAVVAHADGVTDLVEQFRGFHDGLPALFAFTFRLPNLELRPCFYYTLAFYTPEKPSCQNAFRVSTLSYVS